MTGCCVGDRADTSPVRVSIRTLRSTSVGSSGGQIAILETGTGRLLGSADVGQASASVHPGAVYLHQGESYLVDSLDFEDGVAFVHAEDPGYTTFARELTDIAVTGQGERKAFGPITLGLVPVSVSNTVIGYLRRQLTGEVIDFVELDMPTRTLDTKAVMCTITPEALQDNGVEAAAGTRRTARRRARVDRTLAVGGQLRPWRHRGGCPQRWARWTACRRSSSTTDTRAGRDSPTGDSVRLPHGGARLRRPSRPANARSAARRACSRPNAVAAMTRWTNWVLFACCDWCSTNWNGTSPQASTATADPSTAAPVDKQSTVPDGARRSARLLSIETVGYAIRFNPDRSGADVKYLVGGLRATLVGIFDSVKMPHVSENATDFVVLSMYQ